MKHSGLILVSILLLATLASATYNEYSFGVVLYNASDKFMKNTAISCTTRFYNQPTTGGLLQNITKTVTTDNVGYALIISNLSFSLNQTIYRTIQCGTQPETLRYQVGHRMFTLQATDSLNFGGKLPSAYVLTASLSSILSPYALISSLVNYVQFSNLTGYMKANATNNATKWNTAYAWGNHSKAGYLTSMPDVGTQLNYPGYVTYFNEFTGDAVDTYPITLGTQSIQFTSQKFGTYRWITGTTIGNDAGIGLGYTTTTTGSNYNISDGNLDMRLMMASSAGYRMFIGYLKTSGSADMTTINAAAVFFTNTTYGGYWHAMCCNAAGAANCYIVNTTVAKDTNFHRFTIITNGTAKFYIDGILRADISTANKYPKNILYSWVGTYQETTDTAADNHQLDYIYFRALRR
jgi:hypothetical protein